MRILRHGTCLEILIILTKEIEIQVTEMKAYAKPNFSRSVWETRETTQKAFSTVFSPSGLTRQQVAGEIRLFDSR